MSMIDAYFSAALLAVALAVRGAYGMRLARYGHARFTRVDAAGTSPLLSKTAMEATYWAIAPLVRGLVRLHVTANFITAASLMLGVVAGATALSGHLGIAACFAAASALCDALDGFVARELGTASPAGETFDAVADRYNEFFLLGGVALAYHDRTVLLGLALLALHGSFMVSYASARAQGLRVHAPRGAMRRPERAAILTAGCAFSPLAAAAAARFSSTDWGAEFIPLAAALLFVGVGANVSAIRRLVRIAQLASDRAAREPASRPRRGSQPSIRVAG
jgi:CDP-diacylglycerol--glycerol-3-phosphate 3-phosphatidyltransferase